MKLTLVTFLVTVFPYPTSDQVMEAELDISQQFLDSIVQSVKNSIKSAVTSISERQDRFEEFNSKRVSQLHKQISDLLPTIRKHQENLSHHTAPSPSYEYQQPIKQTNSELELTQTLSSSSGIPSHVPFTHSPGPTLENFAVLDNTDPEIDAASRTLGFYPFKEG